MTALRFFLMVMIFGAVSFAWLGLGGSMLMRTESLDASLSNEMANQWGPKVLSQQAPYVGPQSNSPQREGAAPGVSVISADIDHANRYKGLLWYSTFSVKFRGEYTTKAAAVGDVSASRPASAFFVFPLPAGISTYYEQPQVAVDGQPWTPPMGQVTGGRLSVPINPFQPHTISVAYTTGAQDAWVYYPSEPGTVTACENTVSTAGSASMGELNGFRLTVTTNFADIDYPRGSRSPNEPAKATAAGGRQAAWQFGSAITNQAMGVVMPKRQNAGPIAARMSFFAPVSLLFFFTAIFTVVILKKIPLHPMHYLFLSAGFFAFHILMAYLVDLMNIHVAFWICAVVSVLLVVSYLRLVAGVKFAVFYAGMAQLVFLVGFSYAFFWTGYTGLTVTIAAIATLFVIMQATGRVNWSEVFKGTRPPASPPPLPPVSSPAPPPVRF